MWLLKLPLKIIALPVMAVVAVLSIFYSIALHLSSLGCWPRLSVPWSLPL